MTDNRTTELREKLNERGVKYYKRDVGGYRKTSWGKRGSDLVVFIESGIGTPLHETYMTMENPTAEQVIAATLGNGKKVD